MYIYIHICIYLYLSLHIYIYIHMYIHICMYVYTFLFYFFVWGVGCDSVSLYLQFPDPVARRLLRRWIGDPPETLNGLTSNPLSLML